MGTHLSTAAISLIKRVMAPLTPLAARFSIWKAMSRILGLYVGFPGPNLGLWGNGQGPQRASAQS